MRKISYQDEVEQAVWKIGTGKLIVAATLYRDELKSIPELTFYKSLERMVERSKLNRLSRGLYYRAGVTDGEQEIINEIIRFYIGGKESSINGFWGGEYALVDLGILSANKEQRVIYSNRMTQKRKSVCGFDIISYPFHITADQLPYAKLVEVVDQLEKYCDRSDFNRSALEQFVNGIWNGYNDERMINALERRHIPQRKLAFLVKLIEESGNMTKLRERLPGTSRYRILTLEKI